MKKITILVDDDVEMIDIFPVRDEKIVSNIRREGYINQKVLGVNVYKGENKSTFIEEIYPAISIDDNEEENEVLQKALELACEDLSLYEDITTAKYKAKCYIHQAKEELKYERFNKNV